MAKISPQDAQSEPKEEAESKLSSLRKLSVFKGISIDAINKLLAVSSSRFVLRGDFVFKQDEPASSLVIFSKGLAVEFKRSGEVDWEEYSVTRRTVEYNWL
jgi:hypothetical protein